MTVASSTHKYSCTHEDNANYQFEAKIFKLSRKSYVKAISHILPSIKKRSRSIRGHHSIKRNSTLVPNATYQGSRLSVNLFYRRGVLKAFTIYGGSLGHVTNSFAQRGGCQ